MADLVRLQVHVALPWPILLALSERIVRRRRDNVSGNLLNFSWKFPKLA
jgi:hypothetical protein